MAMGRVWDDKQPSGGRRGSECLSWSLTVPRETLPSITQPHSCGVPTEPTALLVAELTWESSHSPSVKMLPRSQRMRQSLALTITWLAISLTSRSWHGSPSSGFSVLQMLLCCKKRPTGQQWEKDGALLPAPAERNSAKLHLPTWVPVSIPWFSSQTPG